MKNIITIMIMLVAVGCMTPAEKLRNSFVGSYEGMGILLFGENTVKLVFLENGKSEIWDGEKKKETTWKIVEREVHVGSEKDTAVYKLEPNGDLAFIAWIKDGERTQKTIGLPWTYKKLKE